MMLAHNVHDVQSFQRHVHANRLNGVDNEWLTRRRRRSASARRSTSRPSARYPVLGAALQRRAGTARHDAVAWGYARGAAARGVDIIQNCPVTAIRRGPDGRVTGVETAKGFIAAKKVAVSAAGHTSVVMETAGVRLPLESPTRCRRWSPSRSSRCFPCVVMSNSVHAYISQSDKGELVIGAGTDSLRQLLASAAASTSSSTRSRRSARSSRSSAACGCCASGAASST